MWSHLDTRGMYPRRRGSEAPNPTLTESPKNAMPYAVARFPAGAGCPRPVVSRGAAESYRAAREVREQRRQRRTQQRGTDKAPAPTRHVRRLAAVVGRDRAAYWARPDTGTPAETSNARTIGISSS